ncbi:MAG: tetratricopeptide repeat protein [Elusimicrobia bacterium]|nr:tetratricopeptide repeat protein [Elusimicrobiota bacterium]
MKIIIALFLFSASVYCGNIESYRDYFEALISEKEGKYEKALEYYSKVISKDQDPYIYRSAMKLAMALGDVPKALEYSFKIVEKDSSSAENWYDYGNVLWAANKKEEAEKAFLNAVKNDPEYAEAYYQLASLNPYEIKKAMYYLNKLIELRPDLKADAYMRAAEIYYNNKDAAKAVEYLKKSAAEDPFYARPRYMLALYYEDTGNWKSALSMYEQIYSADSSNSEVLIKMGEIYLSKLDDKENAEKYFLKAYNISPKNPQSLYWLSALSEIKKDYEKALFYAQRLNEVSPGPANCVKIGYYKSVLNDIKGAVEILSKAYEKWPDNYELAYFLGLGYDDLKEDKKSRFYLEKAVKLKTDYTDARMQLAVLCERMKDTACFKENFEKVIEKEPDNHMALNYLGYSLADRGIDLEYSQKLIEKALSYQPENSAYLDSMSWVLYKKGDYNSALTYIEKALSGGEEDPTVLSHAGDIYFSLKDYSSAWKYYAISNLIKPDKKISSKAQKTFKKAENPNIFYDFLAKKYEFYSPHETECSAVFVFAGKKISADCHISFKDNGDFHIIFYDPLMSPSFYFSFEKEELKMKLPPQVRDNPKIYEYFAQAAKLMRFIFSSKAGDSKEKEGKKIYLTKEKDFFKKIKTSLGLKAYLKRNYYGGKIWVENLKLKFPRGEADIYFGRDR